MQHEYYPEISIVSSTYVIIQLNVVIYLILLGLGVIINSIAFPTYLLMLAIGNILLLSVIVIHSELGTVFAFLHITPRFARFQIRVEINDFNSYLLIASLDSIVVVN